MFSNVYSKKQNSFCDVTIKIGDKIFMAHFLILYARSSFRDVLSKNGTQWVIIPNVSSKAFEVLLN